MTARWLPPILAAVGLSFIVSLATSAYQNGETFEQLLPFWHTEGARPNGDSREVAPYLDIPAIVDRPNRQAVGPYYADRAGLRVRYIGNLFSTNESDLAWVPLVQHGKYLLRWQTFDGKSGLVGIFPGNELTLADNALYDFDVGTLFVKAILPNQTIGYILLETLIGETDSSDNSLFAAHDPEQFLNHASVKFQDLRLYEQTVNDDLQDLQRSICELADPSRYSVTLSDGEHPGVHPLFATSVARSVLFSSLEPNVDVSTRRNALAAVETFIAAYVLPNIKELAPGLFSWPYGFEWSTNWGIKLRPPWYSPYVNGQVATIAAMLYRETQKSEYLDLARKAVRFIVTPIEDGGSEYKISGFRLPAEYVYNTPPLPNIRVLDGELGTSIALYNSARLLGDSEMLRSALRYLASLSMQLGAYSKPDGDLQFSMYIETMPEGYRWPLWALLQDAALITKDRRFTDHARKFTHLIPKKWCDEYGC